MGKQEMAQVLAGYHGKQAPMPSNIDAILAALPRNGTNNPLAGNPGSFDSQGLQQPLIDPIMLMSGFAAPRMTQALAGAAKSAPRLMASEAGALFPKEVPPMAPVSKAELLTDAERQYKLWENMAKQYAANEDFPGILRAKWGMLKNAGGN